MMAWRPNYSKNPGPALLRASVLRRDGFTCQSCGWKPDATLIPANYDGRKAITERVWIMGRRPGRPQVKLMKTIDLEVDHIRPLIDGGTNDPENLQALCSRCNRSKEAADLARREGRTPSFSGWYRGDRLYAQS